jgi:RNA polymerase sigma factor (sigma-70 family)
MLQNKEHINELGMRFYETRGNKEFDEFYKSYYTAAIRTVNKLFPNITWADRKLAVDNFFIQVFEKIYQYKPDRGEFLQWSYSILINSVLTTTRVKNLRKENFLVFNSETNIENKTDWFFGSTEFEDEQHREHHALVEKCWEGLLNLNHPHAYLLQDYYVNGNSLKELSEKYGENLNTIKTRVRAALFQLKYDMGLREKDVSKEGDKAHLRYCVYREKHGRKCKSK